MAILSDPEQGSFGGLTRNPDGSSNDDALAKLLSEVRRMLQVIFFRPSACKIQESKSLDGSLGAFGARNLPGILRAVDILGIERARIVFGP